MTYVSGESLGGLSDPKMFRSKAQKYKSIDKNNLFWISFKRFIQCFKNITKFRIGIISDFHGRMIHLSSATWSRKKFYRFFVREMTARVGVGIFFNFFKFKSRNHLWLSFNSCCTFHPYKIKYMRRF